MSEKKLERVEQVRRINRSNADKTTGNVLTLKTHELIVATDYAPEEVEQLGETFELVGSGEAADYRLVRDPAKDLIDIEGVLVLEFDGLLDRGNYSLFVHAADEDDGLLDRGSYSLFVDTADEETVTIFEDVPFLKLGALSSTIDEEIEMHGEDKNLGR